MVNATRRKLADTAWKMARMPFHGYADGMESNIQPIIAYFPKWTLQEADRLWCAAFVYHCCMEAGFKIPYRPRECTICNLAGCIAWEEFAINNGQIQYHRHGTGFSPEAGDIVLFDHVFCDREHDHIGVIVEVRETTLLVAEGNIPGTNRSGVIERSIDNHIRAYIRIPDGFIY